MVEHDVQQGSPEWHELRLNKITSSRVAAIFKSDNLPLVDELIAEAIAPEIELDGYVSDAMQWGLDQEPQARLAYMLKTGIQMEQVGFCTHDTYDWLGLSPDGFTPDRKGAIEIKCPSTKTHVRYIRMDGIPNEYKYQVYQYFLVNPALEWLDFVSFDPRFSPRILHVVRVTREELPLDETMAGILKFRAKFEDYFNKVTF